MSLNKLTGVSDIKTPNLINATVKNLTVSDVKSQAVIGTDSTGKIIAGTSTPSVPVTQFIVNKTAGLGNYTTIQSAINAIPQSGTVLITDASSYSENITTPFFKRITITTLAEFVSTGNTNVPLIVGTITGGLFGEKLTFNNCQIYTLDGKVEANFNNCFVVGQASAPVTYSGCKFNNCTFAASQGDVIVSGDTIIAKSIINFTGQTLTFSGNITSNYNKYTVYFDAISLTGSMESNYDTVQAPINSELPTNIWIDGGGSFTGSNLTLVRSTVGGNSATTNSVTTQVTSSTTNFKLLQATTPASGAGPFTSNGNSGQFTITGLVTTEGNNSAVITINNTQCTATSNVMLTLGTYAGDGGPTPCLNGVANGSFTIVIRNVSAQALDANVTVFYALM